MAWTGDKGGDIISRHESERAQSLESQKNYDFLRSDFDVPKLEQTSSAEFRFELCHFTQTRVLKSQTALWVCLIPEWDRCYFEILLGCLGILKVSRCLCVRQQRKSHCNWSAHRTWWAVKLSPNAACWLDLGLSEAKLDMSSEVWQC